MHALILGSDRDVPVIAVIGLVATVIANAVCVISLRQRLSEIYPAVAEEYAMDGALPTRGIGPLMANLAFIWSNRHRALSDSTLSALVWATRALQLAFLASLISCWLISTSTPV